MDRDKLIDYWTDELRYDYGDTAYTADLARDLADQQIRDNRADQDRRRDFTDYKK